MKRVRRRTFVRATGATAVAIGLAGCTEDEDDTEADHDHEDHDQGGGHDHGEGPGDNDSDDETGDADDETGDADDETGDTDDETGDTDEEAEFVDEEPDYDGWFENVDNFEATYDFTDEDPVTVHVGADEDLLFEPPAIAISGGTTVVWTWTGESEDHSVVHQDGAFESELESEEGHTFEYTFEEPGTHKYACGQHGDRGMRGAVVVE